MDTKVRFTRQLPKNDFGLLNQMALQAYDSPSIDTDAEEVIRKEWEAECKRLPMSQLKVASVNYELFRETKLIELTNKTGFTNKGL
jgi:thymidylate synthase ThyX